MGERDPGLGILRECLDDRTVLGGVVPAESRLIGLRSVEDRQPLTVRRLDV